jgi:polar amino acid transport system substrate-binding protein
MKRLLLLVAGLVLAGSAWAEPISVVTEPYPGYSVDVNGEIKGAGADQVHLMFQRAGIDYRMQMLPWARAYSMATSQPMTCIYATNHTQERDKLFKWIEPLGGGRVVLMRRAGSDTKPRDLEEAKDFSVGVQRGDYAADYLAKQGFRKLDLASDFSETLKKLLGGRIDLAMTSEAAYLAELAKGQPLEVVMTMPAAIYALACSLDVPDDIVNRLQEQLNLLIADGSQDRIYMQYGMPAQRMQDFVKKIN